MFDIVFAQLGVILRTRNKFFKIVAVAERYIIIPHVKKKSKKQPFQTCFSVKLADGRMSMKKGKICSYLIYNTVSLSKMAEKKQNHLAIEKICCYFE